MKHIIIFSILGLFSVILSPLSFGANCPRPLHGISIKHTYYDLSFKLDDSISEWSCHTITTERLGFKSNRSFPFKADPLLETSPRPTDYVHTGFDRGHLVPAADMSFTATAAKESFYMTNMTPQNPDFNRHVWAKAEEKMRILGTKYKKILVISGPLLNGHLKKLGQTNIVIPQYFFKVGIYKLPNGREEVLSYLIPNQGVALDPNAKPPYPRNWQEILKSFEVPVHHLEQVTGLRLTGN